MSSPNPSFRSGRESAHPSIFVFRLLITKTSGRKPVTDRYLSKGEKIVYTEMADKKPLIILTGGISRRMNRVFKGSLEIDGLSFIELLLRNLSPLFRETLLVGSQKELERYQGDRRVRIAADRYTGIGPFAGILTAFEITEAEEIFLCPCDSPFVSARIAHELFAARSGFNADITIPLSDNRFYPLIGIYHRKVIPHIRLLVERDRNAIRFLFRKCPTLMVHFKDPAPFLNVNTWDEYERLLGK